MILYLWAIIIMLKMLKNEDFNPSQPGTYMDDDGFFDVALTNGKTVKARHHMINEDGSIGLPTCNMVCEGCPETPPGRACAQLCDWAPCIEERD